MLLLNERNVFVLSVNHVFVVNLEISTLLQNLLTTEIYPYSDEGAESETKAYSYYRVKETWGDMMDKMVNQVCLYK